MSAASEAGPARNPWAAAALAWAFPGLGHAYLGRPRRALLYAAIVTVTFLLGLSFQGRLYSVQSGQPLTVLAVTYEYGCAYLLTSGLMNLLLVLDCYDIAAGRKP